MEKLKESRLASLISIIGLILCPQLMMFFYKLDLGIIAPFFSIIADILVVVILLKLLDYHKMIDVNSRAKEAFKLFCDQIEKFEKKHEEAKSN